MLSTIHQVTHMNTTASSDPDGFTEFNGELYFSADDGIHGHELWKTDATGNVALVADINEGSGSSAPDQFTQFNGQLYFSASTDIHGRELWKVSETGDVVLVADINGSDSSQPGSFTQFDHELYFTANDGIHGRELWMLDADEDVVMIADINPTDHSYPGFWTVGDRFYFTADDGIHGRELRTLNENGEVSLVGDTALVSPIIDTMRYFEAFNGGYYFFADDGTHGNELWQFEDSGTVSLVADINPGVDSALPKRSSGYGGLLKTIAGELYFGADDGVHGYQLWKIDGAGEVSRVSDAEEPFIPRDLVLLGGDLYVLTNSGYTFGSELWKLNPSGPLTQLGNGWTRPWFVTCSEETAYFRGEDAEHGMELWQVDTSGNVSLVADLFGGKGDADPRGFVPLDGRLFFAAADVTHGRELWTMDASGDLDFVADINVGGEAAIGSLATLNDTLYFVGDDGTHGHELWKINSSGVVAMVADIWPGYQSSSPRGLTVFGGNLYFSANDSVHGEELWRADDSGNVEIVADITPGSESSSPRDLVIRDESLYFTIAKDGVYRREGWKVDSEGNLSRVVNSESEEFRGGAMVGSAMFEGDLYFKGWDEDHGAELWKVDAERNLSLVADVRQGPDYSLPEGLTVFNDRLYFRADDGIHGRELWSVAPLGNVTLVTDVNPGPESSISSATQLRGYPVFNNQLLFAADDGVHGTELWRIDRSGTASLLADINPGAGSSSPSIYMKAIGNLAYFIADSGTIGRQLWRLHQDGSVTMVTHFDPSEGLTFRGSLTVVDSELHFEVESDNDGDQLWKLDSAGSVVLVADTSPGDSLTYGYTPFNGEIYFRADDGIHGRELWKLSEQEPAELGAVDFVEMQSLDASTGEASYRFESVRTGPVTVDIVYDPAAGSAVLALHNEDGMFVGITSLDEGRARIDHQVAAAGDVFTVRLTGTNSNVDLRICNLIERVDDSLTVHGTGGNDTFEFVASTQYEFVVNGVEYHFGAAEVASALLEGSEGRDTATITGAAGAATLNWADYELNLASGALTLMTTHVEDVTVRSGEGPDVAYLEDSSANDLFTVTPDYAVLDDGNHQIRVEKYGHVHAYARNGGTDRAQFLDSPGRDKVKVEWQDTQGTVKMYGSGYYNRAKFFDKVEADFSAGGTGDNARLWDSPGSDVLEGMPRDCRFYSNDINFDVTVRGADFVTAYSTNGSDDVLALHDSIGNDVFRAKPHKVMLFDRDTQGKTYKFTARKFDNVTVYADQGGRDIAKLYDSAVDDYWESEYRDGETWSSMASRKYSLYEVLAFEQVKGYSVNGGTNRMKETILPGQLDFVLTHGEWAE